MTHRCFLAALVALLVAAFTTASCGRNVEPAAPTSPQAPGSPASTPPPPAPPAPTPPPAPSAPEPFAGGKVRAEAEYDVPGAALNVLETGTPDCPPYRQAYLREPTRIRPSHGVVGTLLIAALRRRCVPVYTPPDPTANPPVAGGWKNELMTLRTYGFPRNPLEPVPLPKTAGGAVDLDHPSIVWSAPGPTFELRKPSKDGTAPGTKFAMILVNAMPSKTASGEPIDSHACDTLTKQGKPPLGPYAGWTPPNCFHGDNSTNFHVHGSHFSPQPHQDFVGLELLPFGAKQPAHATHGSRGITAIGAYDYDFDPVRDNQAEGTHWYHAHKHGATALQVLNGLVGAFVIRGEFDDALEGYFERAGGGKLTEHLLMVQQVQEKQPGLGGGEPPAAALVNGQGNPIVKMKPGEIQRWRIVGATQNANAQFTVSLPPGFAYAQISLDGVQFAPENYICQPILEQNAGDCKPRPASRPIKLKSTTFTIGPATRIDLLVQAPKQPGTHQARYLAPAPTLPRRTKKGVVAPAVAPVNGDHLTVEVTTDKPALMRFPSMAEFPPMPSFLADIPPPKVTRTVAYQLEDQATLDQVQFFINQAKYDPECSNEVLTLGTAEEWSLTNNSGIAHPFHIHTNPFQVVRLDEWVQTKKDAKGNPTGPFSKHVTQYVHPVWRDTLPIPTVSGDDPANLGQAVIRYWPQDFTGEFVNHCHILGHEDRGMMHNVQVICPQGNITDPSTWQFGIPSATKQECADGVFSAKPKPAPLCGVLPAAAPAGAK